MEEYRGSGFAKNVVFSLCQSHNMALLSQHQSARYLTSIPRKPSAPPHVAVGNEQNSHLTCDGGFKRPEYRSVASPGQDNQEEKRGASSLFFLSQLSAHINTSTALRTASEEGQDLPATSNWNVPSEILSGYQRGPVWHTDQMWHQRVKYSGFLPKWARLGGIWREAAPSPQWPIAASSSLNAIDKLRQDQMY